MKHNSEGQPHEDGSAAVEFLAGTLLLLIPIVYLILTFASVQAATYAAESAARETGRIYSRASSLGAAETRAATATRLIFLDHGFDPASDYRVTVACAASPCLTPGAGVHVRVEVNVRLPLVPDFLTGALPTSLRLSAEAFANIDRFGSR